MDHLAPVTEPAAPSTCVPYLGDLCRFNGDEFTAFPESQGWEVVPNNVNGDSIVCRKDAEPSDESLSAFLQAWLFFGLLHQFFHNVGVTVNQDAFVTQALAHKEISTAPLVDLVERLAAIEAQAELKLQRVHLRENLNLLYKAGDLVDDNLSFPRLRYKNDNSIMQILLVAESIAILGETLMHATKKVWAHLPDELNDLSTGRVRKKLRFAEPAALSLKRLELRGWCKSDRMMMSRLVDTMGLAYAAQLKRIATPNGHTKCSMYECLEMQVDLDSYTQKHVSPDCWCEVITVSTKGLVEAIELGRTPKVQIVERDTLEDGVRFVAEVIDTDTEFVAFSHVWAHGLGNQGTNGLPQCQLLRLQDLANKVRAKQVCDFAPTVPFWLDTLCIPVGTEVVKTRNKAIVNIYKVFSKASTVLVLDAEVQNVSANAPVLEKEMRLSTCAWSRRVWTLLEALTPDRGSLWWQFKEEALCASDVWSDDRDRSCRDISYRYTTLDMRYPTAIVTTNALQSLSDNFLNFIFALRYRSVSRVEDETLCIAPLLSMSLNELLTTKDPVIRMKTFLSFWPKIPTYFLFFEGTRIDDDGCRWMPRSFIDGLHKSTALRAEEQFTTFDTEGLLVSYPGLILHSAAQGHLKESLKSGFLNPIDNMWHRIRDTGIIIESKLPQNQRWAYWYENVGLIQRPALILEFPSNYSHNYIIAVLVSIRREENEVMFARYLCRVWLDLAEIPSNATRQSNGSTPTAMNMVSATPAEQKWRVG